ncbi:MAG TPA: peptidoglycan-binding domain-containing protein [bacterium]|nr:peptidoglycan-binding domain-containing protein [bacterium]
MKRIASNFKRGTFLCSAICLLANFALLALIVPHSLVRAASIDAVSLKGIEEAPFFKDNGFVVNTKPAPDFGGKYWLEKDKSIPNYTIDLAKGAATNLSDGSYPIMLVKAPTEDLAKYYEQEFGLSDEYIKGVIDGHNPFAFINISKGRARLIRNEKIDSKSLDNNNNQGQIDDHLALTVSYKFPVGEYSFLLTNKNSQLAKWQFRVVDNYPAADIFAVETAYNSLTLGSNKIYENINLPTTYKDTEIKWTSSDTNVMTNGGIINRSDTEDLPVTLTARISSGSFFMDKTFDLIVVKNDPYLEINNFTANGKSMINKENSLFIFQKQDGIKKYIIDFASGYKTNLQQGKYAVRFDNLSEESQDKLIKYYSKDNLSDEDSRLIAQGKEPHAYIQKDKNGQLRLISSFQDSANSKSKPIIGIDQKNSFLIREDYPDGLYDIVADLDGFDGHHKIKWQVEVAPVPVIIDPDSALVQADYDALTLASPVTEDFDLKTSGINGSSISWSSNNSGAIAINGNIAQVTRPEFSAGDTVVQLTATLTKGSITRTKTFSITVLKNEQVVPTTGGGGGGGIAHSLIPQSVSAINVPLSLVSSQDGVLTQSLSNGLQARLVVSPNSFVGGVTFIITEGPEDNALGGRHFILTAVDSNGNPVRNFTNNLNITFSGLPLPDNIAGVGVYYYDEALLSWVLVPGAIFDQAGGSVNFFVNHLTKFAVFSEQPVLQQVLGETTYADGTLLRGSDRRIFVVVDGKLQHILTLKELAQYANQEILDVEDSIIASYPKASPKAVLGVRKYNFNRDLKTGMTGDDVRELQRYLNNNGYVLAKTGPGSAGQETKKFGRATREALIKFQKANKINPAVGYFGTITRKAVNK